MEAEQLDHNVLNVNKKVLLLTSHWQNGGKTAKLNIPTFLAAECVSHSLFFVS